MSQMDPQNWPLISAAQICAEQIKRFAYSEPRFGSRLVHISQLEVDGPHAAIGGTFYHPRTLEPMHARLRHQTPHFYFKDLQELRPRSTDRCYGEGIVHFIAKEVVRSSLKFTLPLDGDLIQLSFSSVKLEHVPRAPHSDRRIDLVGVIREPESIRNRLGGGICLEVVCHNPVSWDKEQFLRRLPYAAAILTVPSGMLREIEQEERSMTRMTDDAFLRVLSNWQARLRGLIKSGKCTTLFHIPGEGEPPGTTHPLPLAQFPPRSQNSPGALPRNGSDTGSLFEQA